MKLLFIVYFFTGTVLGFFFGDLQRQGVHLMDCAILLAIHFPAILLTIVGVWVARKKGAFLGLDLGLYLVVAILSYAVGVGIGIYAQV